MNAQKYVIGNWKLNPATLSQACQLASSLVQMDKSVQVGCVPSFVHLSAVGELLAESSILLGAQDVCAKTATTGAFTGDVSAGQLADIGVKFVIIGHSERRAYYGEDNALLEAKIQQAVDAGLTVVFCVGETKLQYQAQQTLAVLDEQLSVLKSVPADRLIVAYEPVWAIGTGLTPSIDEVIGVHRHIKQVLAGYAMPTVSVLYGGSVNEKNAAEFATAFGVDGALVGGASLKIEAFSQIVAAFADN